MSPELHFRGQPLRKDDFAGAVLRQFLADESVSSLSIAVAWARFGGLARIEGSIRGFRERGGSSVAIIGIDEGGASRPGLLKALDLFDRVLIFHDPTGRTFHPKVYLASGPTKASLLVGSSNATAGGLFFNYEASLEAEFDLPEEETHEALVGARAYFDLLQEDTPICIELTPELIDQLVDDPRYLIAETERRRGAGAKARPDGAEEHESDAVASGEVESELSTTIFGESTHEKPPIPPLPSDARQELQRIQAEADEPTEQAEAEQQGAPPEPDEIAADERQVVASWSKTLTHADAQQPTRPGTNPTGNLRLAKGALDIDTGTWFRDELFGSAPWTPTQDHGGNDIEEATVSVEVTIGGVALGAFDVRVSHGAHRIAEQGNVPTFFHWGPELAQVLRQTDYSGHTVTIDRLDDDSYRLAIN